LIDKDWLVLIGVVVLAVAEFIYQTSDEPSQGDLADLRADEEAAASRRRRLTPRHSSEGPSTGGHGPEQA